MQLLNAGRENGLNLLTRSTSVENGEELLSNVMLSEHDARASRILFA
jgi:hypothetical protein